MAITSNSISPYMLGDMLDEISRHHYEYHQLQQRAMMQSGDISGLGMYEAKAIKPTEAPIKTDLLLLTLEEGE